jgi:ribonuclease HI
LELAVEADRTVEFRWVKGHSGDRWNDFVDELAVAAATEARGSG